MGSVMAGHRSYPRATTAVRPPGPVAEPDLKPEVTDGRISARPDPGVPAERAALLRRYGHVDAKSEPAMPDRTLQNLIDRIRADAIDAAEVEAARITSAAREQAEAILRQARTEAAKIGADAETSARRLCENGQRSLQQAARDLILLVGQAIERVVGELVTARVDDALRIDVIEGMLVRVAAAYFQRGVRDRRIDLLLSPEDRDHFVRFFKEELQGRLTEGIDIRIDKSVGRGFKIFLADQQVFHDFTSQGIGEALATLLRPELAEIVRRAAASVGRAAERPACP
jgi:V/A-type H+-transporting ATPase subunit E